MSACLWKKTSRFFSVAPELPKGLRYIPHFVSVNDHALLLDSSDMLANKIMCARKDSKSFRTRTYLSKQHNLKTEETYELIHIPDGQRKLTAQSFEDYGDRGHMLTYFIGNENIPSYLLPTAINVIEELDAIKRYKDSKCSPISWNFAFNTYSIDSQNTKAAAGFPYHVDTESNGDITVIITLKNSAEMQIRPVSSGSTSKEPQEHKIEHPRILLEPGSLLLLSGEARWEWEHRIIPQIINDEEEENDDKTQQQHHTTSSSMSSIYRMSLVLGCR